MELILGQLVAGAAGGHAISAGLLQTHMGPISKTLTGVIGGSGGATLLTLLINGGATAAELTTSSSVDFVGLLAGAGAGGAVLTGTVGYIKQKFGI